GAALMLDAMQAYDPDDPAGYRTETNFASHLKADGLEGKRIGVVRNLMGYNNLLDEQFEQQLSIMEAQGAEIINVEMTTYGEYGGDEFTVLLYEFKQDMAAYLKSTNLPYNNLSDMIAANNELPEQ
ncbi:hypothetical protein R0J89_14700, partial [Psychrobacter sp. SIMBA_152]